MTFKLGRGVSVHTFVLKLHILQRTFVIIAEKNTSAQ